MEIKRDSHGRPIGLQWPERPPNPEVLEKHRRAAYSVSRKGMGGRPPQEYCGAGLHLMSEYGKPIKSSSGRYCAACQLERNRKNRKKKKDERRG